MTPAEWLGLLVDVVNLAVVIWIVGQAQRDRRADRRLTAQSFWLQEMVLAPNRAIIQDALAELLTAVSHVETVGLDGSARGWRVRA